MGLLDDFGDDGLGVGSLNNCLLVNLIADLSSLLLVPPIDVSLMHNWNVFLLDDGGVLLVNHWLMVLMNVLLNHHWLMMLMDNVLMVLVHDVLLVFHDHILVVLMDNILMDFLHDGCIGVGSVFLCKFMSVNGSSLILALVDGLFLVSDDNGLFVDLLNVGVSVALMVVC